MTRFFILLNLAVTLTALCSCGRATRKGEQNAMQNSLSEAHDLYAMSPRTEQRVTRAWQLAEKALKHISRTDTSAFADLLDGTRYALWLAINSAEKPSKSRYASEAQRLATRLIHIRKDRAEGYYYRAIAVGIFSDLNRRNARPAMRAIRDDALAAIELHESHDYGGPHRLLGALYLRAPGPPAGIGSIRRAAQHLEKAREIAPNHPENLNFLAEVYLKLGRRQPALQLIEKALAADWPDDGLVTRENRRKESESLRERILDIP